MTDVITEHIDIWTSAITTKKSVGRGSSKKQESYGIKKLRELILELAVRGKLVPQDSNDKPASVLLDKVSKEKEFLIKEGKIRKQKSLTKISEEEIPFKIPEKWEWTRLLNYYDVRDGTHDSPKTQLSGYPLVTSKNLYTGKLDLSNVKYISKEDHLKINERSKVEKGDILFAMIGSIGNPVIVDIDDEFSIKNVALFKYYNPELVVPRYLQIYLELASADMKATAAGGVQAFVSLGKLRSYLMPIPPLLEQHRIVSKVDELMALCDKLEEEQEENGTTHQILVETLLNTLTDVETPEAFTQSWQRIVGNFDVLFTTEKSIDKLQETILQLAVMGKLVAQDQDDEPASVLLEKIAEEKERLVKEGKIKKQIKLLKVIDSEKSFKLKKGWEWTKLGNLSANIHYGYTASAIPNSAGVRLLRITDIQNDSVDWESVPSCEIEDNKVSNYLLEDNDILIARTGGTIGKSYLVENIDVKSVFASYLIRVQKIEKMYPPYIKIFLKSPFYWQQLYENSQGTGQPNVNATALKNLAFPIPPLEEQHRIVTKVDDLMVLCDSLKSSLREAKTIQVYLADTIAKKIVGQIA